MTRSGAWNQDFREIQFKKINYPNSEKQCVWVFVLDGKQ